MTRPPEPHAAARASWLPIIGCYLAGVLAAAQLGKMSALAPLIAADLQLSLTTVAIAISLLEIGGATLGVVAGAAASRLGLAGSLLGSLLCLAVAAAGSGLAQSGAALLAWRLLEAVAYLGVVVTAPVLIVRAAHDTHIGPAMALWSTFVPVGIAFGAWGWSQAAALSDWRTAMFAGAGLAAAALAVGAASAASRWRASAVARARRDTSAGASASASTSASISASTRASASAGERPPTRTVAAPVDIATWWLSVSFGGYATFEVGLLALLPLYLTREAGVSAAEAGRWAALAALATIAGSAAAALWLRRGVSPRWPVLLSLFVPAAMLFGVFTTAPQAGTAAVLAVVLNALSGAYPSFAFAWLPRAAGGAAQLVRANGIFTQFGASGSLLGPPLMAWCVERFGWASAPWLGLALTVPAAFFAMKALRRLQVRATEPAQPPAAPAGPGATAGPTRPRSAAAPAP
ncbi:MAG: MFS transporter [Burkholderiales bacterium]|nr:MFS transporter [Burkholderiales bacterium]